MLTRKPVSPPPCDLKAPSGQSLALCSCPGPLCARPLGWVPSGDSCLLCALGLTPDSLLPFFLLKKLSPAGFVAPSWPHTPQLPVSSLRTSAATSSPPTHCGSVYPAALTLCTSAGQTPLSLGPCTEVRLTPAGEDQASLYLLSKPWVS